MDTQNGRRPSGSRCVALVGPYLSGKTTLLNVLAGLATPMSGSVTLNEQPVVRMPAAARARAVGVLPQHEESEFWGTVLEYVSLGRFPHAHPWPAWRDGQAGDETAAHGALQRVELADFAARHFATLSGGERQRVRIAQLLAQSPRFLLLDEPLQHLDLRYQSRMLALAAALALDERPPRGVVLVLHDALWPARACTHALLLDGAGGALAGAADARSEPASGSLYPCDQISSPARMPGSIKGNVIETVRSKGPAPSVRAASSRPGSMPSKASLTALTASGRVMTAVARIAPPVVKANRIPQH